MISSNQLLSFSIWLPIAFGILVLFMHRDNQKNMARMVALVGSVASFAVTIPLWMRFDTATAAMQFVERIEWVARFNVYYALGVDGISMLFILLNSFTTVIVIIAAWQVIQTKTSQYLAAFLIMSGLINGVFAATDAILFYVFFEAMLIPMFLIIGIWGGPNRVYAAVKFFLYTLLGSLLMLAAIIYLYNITNGSFDLADFKRVYIAKDVQILLFFAFFASFAVKVPMWPVHTWLPDAHVEAPTGGSVVLAAITLKIGAYGFLRFNMSITPDAAVALQTFMITLSLIAVVYIGFVALAQSDMKKLVAYSSISHMGFVTLGFFLFNAQGWEGALLQMISHGFISAAMFLSIGVLYDRVHSREISAYGGVINTMPKFAFFAVFFAMANSGLPGTSGFVGEFMVIMGALRLNFWIAFAAATTLILGAAYSLWMVKRVVFGDIANDDVRGLTDINGREMAMLLVLAIAVLAMGVYPDPMATVMHKTVDALLTHVQIGKLN
jgi:NADH-quinone oxidoreductase subunit M